MRYVSPDLCCGLVTDLRPFGGNDVRVDMVDANNLNRGSHLAVVSQAACSQVWTSC